MNTRDLNVWLAQRGMTQKQLATSLNISQDAITRYKRTDTFPKWFPLALGIEKIQIIAVKPFDGGDITNHIVSCKPDMTSVCNELGFDKIHNKGECFARVYDESGVEFLIRVEV